MEKFNIIPDTNIIASVRNRGITESEALAEFIDNSFGVSSGAADNFIYARFGATKVMVIDNGVGVSDIVQMARLGGSDSKGNTHDIGQYGIGSKEGALSFGNCVLVESVNKGQYSAFKIDWGVIEKSGEWVFDAPVIKPAELAPSYLRDGGTAITITKLHRGRSKPLLSTLSDELGLLFNGAIQRGKTVRFLSLTSGALLTQNIIDSNIGQVVPPASSKINMADEELGTFSIDGKPAAYKVGVIDKYSSRYSGIHISFDQRTIEVVRSLNGQPLPRTLVGFVSLGAAWKDSLSANKTKLVDSREEFEVKLWSELQGLIEKLSQDNKSRKLLLHSAKVANLLASKMSNLTKFVNLSPSGEGRGTVLPKKGERPKPDPNRVIKKRNKRDKSDINLVDIDPNGTTHRGKVYAGSQVEVAVNVASNLGETLMASNIVKNNGINTFYIDINGDTDIVAAALTSLEAGDEQLYTLLALQGVSSAEGVGEVFPAIQGMVGDFHLNFLSAMLAGDDDAVQGVAA